MQCVPLAPWANLTFSVGKDILSSQGCFRKELWFQNWWGTISQIYPKELMIFLSWYWASSGFMMGINQSQVSGSQKGAMLRREKVFLKTSPKAATQELDFSFWTTLQILWPWIWFLFWILRWREVRRGTQGQPVYSGCAPESQVLAKLLLPLLSTLSFFQDIIIRIHV